MVNGIKLKLVSHFYCGKDWKSNRAIKMWFACFRHYSKMFDDCLVVVATDDVENDKFNHEAVARIADASFCRNTTVKIERNTSYRESRTFFDEVVNATYDGLVFFSHTKGYTNYGAYPRENIDSFILGLWWYSLSDPAEAVASLTFDRGINNFFFGSFPIMNSDKTICFDQTYYGAFFWSNMNNVRFELGHSIENVWDSFPPPLSSRMYSEKFAGMVLDHWRDYKETKDMTLGKNKLAFISGLDLYNFNNGGECVRLCCEHKDVEEYKDFLAFSDKILSEVDGNG